jgi:hypothetical protein
VFRRLNRFYIHEMLLLVLVLLLLLLESVVSIEDPTWSATCTLLQSMQNYSRLALAG